MAQVVQADALPKDLTYEPPLKIEFGVNSGTVGARRITMGRTVIPAGTRNQPHIHLNCEVSMYVISGRMRAWTGSDPANLTPQEVPAGHFCYVPAGEIHGVENMSDRDPVVLVFAYGGVPNKEAAGTVPADQGARQRA